MNFRIRRAEDINCEKCNRLIARELNGQVQIKSGKTFVHTVGPVSIECWNCGYANLLAIEPVSVPLQFVPVGDTA